MTPEEVLALAREGHPRVLSAIINRSTQPHNITVRVARQDGCLHVLIEGEAIANQTSLATFIQSSLTKLRLNPKYAVKVYGRQIGHKSVAWSQDIQISSSIPPNAHFQRAVNQPSEPTYTQPEPASDSAETLSSMSESSSESSGLAASTSESSTSDPSTMPPSSSELSDPWASEEISHASAEEPTKIDEATETDMSIPTPQPYRPSQTDVASTGASTGVSAEAPLKESDASETSADDTAPEHRGEGSVDQLLEDSEGEDVDFQELMKRPEALVIVLFTIVLYIWQLYTSLMESAAPEGSVSGHELAARLGVSQSTISRRKLDESFAAWTQSLDPDQIAWIYADGRFVPQIPDFGADL